MREIPRREALRRLGLLVGGALSASTVAGLLGGCRAEGGGYAFRALDGDQEALVGTLADLIIPETDTPGARAAGVPGFIDRLMADWMDDGERAAFLAGLADVDARARHRHDAPFVRLGTAEQTALLAELDREAFAEPAEEPAPGVEDARGDTDTRAEQAEQAAGQPEASAEEAPSFFMTLKELTIAGYYSSEVGATQELRWNPAPGRLDIDVPFAEVGRTWA